MPALRATRRIVPATAAALLLCCLVAADTASASQLRQGAGATVPSQAVPTPTGGALDVTTPTHERLGNSTPADLACKVAHDCHNHGVCANDKCVCYFWFFGPLCQYHFSAVYPRDYYPWLATVVAAQAGLVIALGYNLSARFCGRSCRTANVRDGAALLTLVGCAIRLLWLADPFNTSGQISYGIADSVMLRLPQVLYFLSFLLVLIMWDSVKSAVHPNPARTAALKCCTGLSGVILISVSMACGIIWTYDASDDYKTARIAAMVGNLVFAVASVLVIPVSIWFARRVYQLLQRAETLTTLSQQATFRQAMRTTMITLLWMCFFATILVGAVVVQSVYGWTLHDARVQYVIFLFLIHAVVEPGIAASLGYCTWQQVPERYSFCARCCPCCAPKPREKTSWLNDDSMSGYEPAPLGDPDDDSMNTVTGASTMNVDRPPVDRHASWMGVPQQESLARSYSGDDSSGWYLGAAQSKASSSMSNRSGRDLF